MRLFTLSILVAFVFGLSLIGCKKSVRTTAETSGTNPSSEVSSENPPADPVTQQAGPQKPSVIEVLVNDSFQPILNKTVSRLTSVRVKFNVAVDAKAGAFSFKSGSRVLSNQNNGGIVVHDNGTSQLNLTFDGATGVEYGSLADGSWIFTVSASQVADAQDASVMMEADYVHNHFRRFFGDYDGNGVVNNDDQDQFGNTFGLSSSSPGFLSEFDYNNDNAVDGTDFIAFSNRFGQALDSPIPHLIEALVNNSFVPDLGKTVSRLTSIQIKFDRAVNFEAGAFSLTNGTHVLSSSNGGGILVAGNGSNLLTLTFTGNTGVEYGSLADGSWTLGVVAAKIISAESSIPLLFNVTLWDFRRLFGDYDGNGTVDLNDMGYFGNTFGLSAGAAGFISQFDYNNDNTVDGTDFIAFSNQFGQVLP